MSLSPKETSHSSLSVLGSNFHFALIPLRDEYPLEKALEDFREEFPKADHYPYAFSRLEKIGCGDDGEPHGSASLPFLSLLGGKGIDDALLIVARYFGGTKLGLGRLKKTFLEGAKEAVAKASLLEIGEATTYRGRIDYASFYQVRDMLERGGATFTYEEDGEDFVLTFSGDDKIIETVLSRLRETEDLGTRRVYRDRR